MGTSKSYMVLYEKSGFLSRVVSLEVLYLSSKGYIYILSKYDPLRVRRAEEKMSQEILDKIREGLDKQIKQCIEEDGIPQPFVQSVTQSYLLLQILYRLDSIDTR